MPTTPSDSPEKPPRARRPGTGGVTLNDVARLAGVSAITISRALNKPATVSQETLQRVKDAVAKSGYVPNLMAGGLASNRSRLVAALVPTIAGPVFQETIQALTETLDEAGCQLILGQSGYTGARGSALIDALVGRRPDGIVLIGILESDEGRRRLLASGIPVVETWDLTDSPIDMLVGFSHEKVGEEVASYLFKKGRRKPALLTADDHRAKLRQAGFLKRCKKLGLRDVPVEVVPAPSALANGRSGFARLLAQHPGIDVIFCGSDVLAHGVLTESHAMGLRVPEDISVMGFGDMPFAAHTHPPLATVRIDGTAIGRQAGRFILDRVQGKEIGERIRDLGFAIVPRASVKS